MSAIIIFTKGIIVVKELVVLLNDKHIVTNVLTNEEASLDVALNLIYESPIKLCVPKKNFKGKIGDWWCEYSGGFYRPVNKSEYTVDCHRSAVDIMNRIANSVNLMDTIRRYTSFDGQLDHKGIFLGKCPLPGCSHKEGLVVPEEDKEFMVNSNSRGTFYCKRCGRGGDVISFICHLKKISPTESVQYFLDKNVRPCAERTAYFIKKDAPCY